MMPLFHRRTRIPAACLTLLLLGAAACTAFNPPESPQAPVEMPDRYSLYAESSSSEALNWWASFHNSELDALMDKALVENLTLQEAWARLKQSAALHKVKGSALFPTLSGETGAETTRREGDDTVNSTTDSVYLGLAASYEVDLWGRLRALNEAEGKRLLAGRADVETAAVTLSGEVTENWVDLIAVRNELEVLDAQMTLNRTLLTALEWRFENSLVSAVDVLRQRKVIERQLSERPSLKEKESRLENSLALLLGKPPGQAPAIHTATLPELGALPATGLPADLLAMRPDVRAAGLRLKAEEWEVSAAKADRLPSLAITARARYSSDGVESLFDNWFTNLAANITGPIFDAGRRKAEVDRAQAQAEERLAAYRRTVLTALSEVENSLSGEVTQQETVDALTREIETARLTLLEERNRYTQGVSSYVDLLGELKDLQELERKLVLARALLVKQRIALHRALGGNWTQHLAPDTTPEATAPSKTDETPKGASENS